MALQVYDTLRRGKVDFVPVRPGHVGMYVCGMTVQSIPHTGHMRVYVTTDVIRRVFRARGYRVKLVQNFTDIDDRIIAKANDAGEDWRDLVQRNIDAYFEAADWLGIERADVYPRATEHIDEIQAMISTLIEKGHAYASGGDVFFAVTSHAEYGKLSGKRIDELRAGVRVDVDEDKRHPVDFALWKAAKPGEPSWESPWGPGRPGWHIECSAMAIKHLGETLDLHGGGRDLVFPHHENELAQSECATGRPFCRHWNENGLLNLGGQKMSKSTGVVFNVEDLRKEVEAAAVRLYLLSTHYRSPIEYGRERLDEAKARLDRLRNFLQSAAHAVGDGNPGGVDPGTLEGVDRELHETLERCEREYHEALDDDFNTAGALGKVYEIVREGNAYVTAGQGSPRYRALLADAARRVRDLTGLLGIEVAPAGGGSGGVPAEVQALVDQREAARKSRNWPEADRLREALREAGWAVEDRPEGPLVKSLDSVTG